MKEREKKKKFTWIALTTEFRISHVDVISLQIRQLVVAQLMNAVSAWLD